ncbi:MAG: PEP-CTERM sorting domain-containing protein [Phycisphaerae bacterium]|nr:PEP-CTERM sorting domain-containing protein [Phycisphaerae bacterium]
MPGHGFSDGAAVSADGSVVVGFSGHLYDEPEAFVWTGGVMTSLGDLEGGPYCSTARGISSDGSIIVGGGNDELWTSQPVVWTNGVISLLDNGAGNPTTGIARDVSADGSVIVGTNNWEVWSAEGYPCMWNGGVATCLGDLPGGTAYGNATAISADGTVIVGNCWSANGKEAFRWEAGIMTGLGALTAGNFSSMAMDVSGDGSVIVGYSVVSEDWPDKYAPFIWTAEGGMRSMADYLSLECGFDLTDWELVDAWVRVSDDGMTFVGCGCNPEGEYEAWIAHVPEPVTVAVFVAGTGLLLRRTRGARGRRIGAIGS